MKELNLLTKGNKFMINFIEIKDGKIFFLMLKKNSNNLSSYY